MSDFETARIARDKWANVLIEFRNSNPERFVQLCNEFNIILGMSDKNGVPFDVALALVGLASLQMDLAVLDNPPKEKDPG